MGCSSSTNVLNSVVPTPDNIPPSQLDTKAKPMKKSAVVPSSSTDTLEGSFSTDKSGLFFRDAHHSDMNILSACKQGNYEEVSRILTVDATLANTLGMWSSTPLMIALQFDFVNIAELLLSTSGIDVNHINEKGATALLYACMGGFESIVTQLISLGANICPSPAISVYNPQKDKNFMCTPFSIACMNDFDKIVSFFISHGIEKDASFEFHAWKLLKKVKGMIEEEKFGLNMTPFALACASGSVKVVRELVHLQANILAKDSRQMTGFHHCLFSLNDSEALEVLKAIKSSSSLSVAMLETYDIEGFAPVHVACDNRAFDCVKFLLEEGCNASLKAKMSGTTPLHIAVKKRAEDLVDLLLKWGADPILADSKGVSPLDLSVQLKKESKIAISLKSAAESWKNCRNASTDASDAKAKASPMEMSLKTESIMPADSSSIVAGNQSISQLEISSQPTACIDRNGANGELVITDMEELPVNSNFSAIVEPNKLIEISDNYQNSFVTPIKTKAVAPRKKI